MSVNILSIREFSNRYCCIPKSGKERKKLYYPFPCSNFYAAKETIFNNTEDQNYAVHT